MKAIKKELGEDEGTVESKELEDKIKAAKMPEAAEKVATVTTIALIINI